MNKDSTLKFCGKVVTTEELTLINELVEEFWGIPQTELASTVCELLEWKSANGKLKTVECRQFLQGMEEAGLIKLLLKRHKGKSKNAPIERTNKGRAREQITGSVHDLLVRSCNVSRVPSSFKNGKFVETRFRGTSYRAANWLGLGLTKGRGRMDEHQRNSGSEKSVWVYPLHRRAKRLLSGIRL